MAATNAELEARLATVEAVIAGAIPIPKGTVEIDDTSVTDKTGWVVYGTGKPTINNSKRFQAVSLVADPQDEADFETPFIFKAF